MEDDLLWKKRLKCVDFCRGQCYYKQAVADAAAHTEEKYGRKTAWDATVRS